MVNISPMNEYVTAGACKCLNLCHHIKMASSNMLFPEDHNVPLHCLRNKCPRCLEVDLYSHSQMMKETDLAITNV